MKTLAIILFLCALSFSQEKKPIIYPESYAIAPTIIGGLDSLEMKLQWPSSADTSFSGGIIYILVSIDTLGNVDTAYVIKGLGADFDKEALRVLKTAKFTPAYRHKLISPRYIDVEKREYTLVPMPIEWALRIKFKRN